MMTMNRKKVLPSNLSRRVILKLLLGLSGILGLLHFVAYGSFLSFKPEVEIGKKRVANISQILPNSAIYFMWPGETSGYLIIMTRDTAGTLQAFDATCPHAGCQVFYDDVNHIMTCGCHGSMFDSKSGNVIQGPAATPLPRIELELDKDGEIYAIGFAGGS